MHKLGTMAEEGLLHKPIAPAAVNDAPAAECCSCW